MMIFKNKLIRKIKEQKQTIRDIEEAWDYTVDCYTKLNEDFRLYMQAKQKVENGLREDLIKELNKNAKLEQEIAKLKGDN